MSARIPLVFKIYFVVIGIVRPVANVSTTLSESIDVVYRSYGLAGFLILIYQVIVYPFLILSALKRDWEMYAGYVVASIIGSEVFMLILSLTRESLEASGGYILFDEYHIIIPCPVI